MSTKRTTPIGFSTTTKMASIRQRTQTIPTWFAVFAPRNTTLWTTCNLVGASRKPLRSKPVSAFRNAWKLTIDIHVWFTQRITRIGQRPREISLLWRIGDYWRTIKDVKPFVLSPFPARTPMNYNQISHIMYVALSVFLSIFGSSCEMGGAFIHESSPMI